MTGRQPGARGPGRPPSAGMVWVPWGQLSDGLGGVYLEERRVRRVAVDGFWMDDHPVTVTEFRREGICGPYPIAVGIARRGEARTAPPRWLANQPRQHATPRRHG